jgi:hypothetical protein
MSDDAFVPIQLAIFKYADGGGNMLSADPLAIRAELATRAINAGHKLNDLIEAANAIDLKGATEIQVAEAWQAMMTLAQIATEAFELVPFDKKTGVGADAAHALAVLDHFHSWLKKNRQTRLSPPMSTPQPASTSATPPTTATSSASS